MSTKIYKSREDHSILSSLYLLDDNKNKLNIVNKINLYVDKINSNPYPTIKKSEITLFLSHIIKYLKLSHDVIRSNLPYAKQTTS